MNFGSAPSRVQQLREAMAARPPAPQQQARAGLLPQQQPAPTAPAAPAASAPSSSPLANLERKVLAGRDPRRIGTPLDSPVARVIGGLMRDGVVTPWDTETKYNEHAAAFTEYQQIQQKHAPHIQGGVFVVNTPQDQAKYQELQRAATRVETTGQAFEQTRDRELFGISRRVADLNKGAADFLNLPAVTPRAETVHRERVAPHIGPMLSLMNKGGPIPALARAAVPGYRRAESDFFAGIGAGGYERFRVEPLTAAGSVAVGFLGGAAMKGATLLPKVGPVVVAKGPTIAKGVEALYVGSVGVRTAGAGPDYFEMGREFGGILTTEAIPMYGGVKAFTTLSPRVGAGVARAKDAYLSHKIRDAPAAQVKAGGHYPDNEMILEGLRMQESRSPFVSARSLSRSRPGKAGTFVEVGPGRYVEKGGLDTYLRRFEVEAAHWRRPIPPEFVAREDILDAPAHWRTPEFGGQVGRQDPVHGWPERRIAGGHYPDNEMILEGLRMQESRSPFVSARSLSRSRPGKAGTFVEVGPGRYVEKGGLDTYLRRFEVEAAHWRRPIPPEFVAREDILDAPAHWRTPEFGGPPAPITVTKMYAGIPIRISRQGLRVGRSTYSRSGQPLRIRPPRADLTMADATKTRFLLPLASGTGETLASGETILSRLEPTIASRAQSATLTASGLRDILATRQDIDTSELTKSSLTLDSSLIPASALRSAQAQDSLLLTTSRLTSRQRQRSDTIPRPRLRETTVGLPRLRPKLAPLPKIPRTPMVFGLPERTPPKKKRKKKGKKKEFDEFLTLPDLSRLWRF